MHERDLRDIEAVGQVALHVTSIDAAVRFYGDTLGLEHLFTFGDLAFFDCGGVRLYLQAVPSDRWTAGSIIYFRVGDLPGCYERLAAEGVEFVDAPHMIHRHVDGSEEWMVFFADPSDNTLALMSTIAPMHGDTTA